MGCRSGLSRCSASMSKPQHLTLDKFYATLGAAIIISETSVFTQRAHDLLTDEAYRELQVALINRSATGLLHPR